MTHKLRICETVKDAKSSTRLVSFERRWQKVFSLGRPYWSWLIGHELEKTVSSYIVSLLILV